MHFLLIPYSLLSLFFIFIYAARQDADSRNLLVLTAALTMGMMFMVMMQRPPTGDSWRYFRYFLDLRSMGLVDALAYHDPDPLYALLNWIVGRIGDNEWLLFGATLILYFGGFVIALRRLLGPVNAAVLLMIYAAFPFFVAYAASGLRQGLALVFLLNAFVDFRQEKRTGWVWLLLAPLWHSGAMLAVSVAVLHWAMCRFVRSERARWALVLSALLVAIALSASGLNASLVTNLTDYVSFNPSKNIYFENPEDYGYLSGFRIDFLLFSLLPLATGMLLRVIEPTFQYSGSGWWLSLYLSLNTIYHLFSFAPFADRFAAFSWFIMPLVVFLQILETHNRRLVWEFMAFVAIVNVAMLQLYTGNFILAPQWW